MRCANLIGRPKAAFPKPAIIEESSGFGSRYGAPFTVSTAESSVSN